jgi:hypothetical protein
MFDHDTDPIPLADLVIYDGDELLFDGSDASTYTVCHTAEDIRRALGAGRADNAEH